LNNKEKRSNKVLVVVAKFFGTGKLGPHKRSENETVQILKALDLFIFYLTTTQSCNKAYLLQIASQILVGKEPLLKRKNK
jgi:hypothetical protein